MFTQLFRGLCTLDCIYKCICSVDYAMHTASLFLQGSGHQLMQGDCTTHAPGGPCIAQATKLYCCNQILFLKRKHSGRPWSSRSRTIFYHLKQKLYKEKGLPNRVQSNCIVHNRTGQNEMRSVHGGVTTGIAPRILREIPQINFLIYLRKYKFQKRQRLF